MRLLFAISIVFGLVFFPTAISTNAEPPTILEVIGDKYPIEIDDQTFLIYYGYGASFEVSEEHLYLPQPNLISMSINSERKSLEIEFEKIIEISLFWVLLPPDLISAEDYSFQVFVDGKETQYDLVIHSAGPRVGFLLPPNAESVEIIGTKVIPEFGTITMMILVVAIVSIIVASTRSKLNIMARLG